AANADERPRACHELWIGGKCGTRACGFAKVTAGWPTGEVEGGATDERVDRDKRQVRGWCHCSAPTASQQYSKQKGPAARRHEATPTRDHLGEDTPPARVPAQCGNLAPRPACA